jgi:hypothetical protein
MTGVISDPGTLNFDHIGAQVGQVLGTPRASQHSAKI